MFKCDMFSDYKFSIYIKFNNQQSLNFAVFVNLIVFFYFGARWREYGYIISKELIFVL